MRATLVGLCVNLVLGVVKLVAGLIGGSFALISDAVNSLGDTLSSIVTLAALWYAQLPADEEHPYGHTRVEAVAGAYVAVLIVITGIYVGGEAIVRFGSEILVPPTWTLWIAGANVLIKETLYWYNRAIGLRTGSIAIAASAWDHRSDALCSLAVLVGLSLVRWAGPSFAWADSAAALLVVIAILWSGGRLLVQSTGELLDPQADATFVEQIRSIAESVAGVRAVETLWVRKTGIEYFVDIHIQVDAQMSVEAGHRIGHQVKHELVSTFDRVKDVLVHLEPYYPDVPVTVD
ncbi:MAG TPA: cation transporter [Planctomycetaceae bacterium]|nr:cation transporter [Planctomycetaceae bacterium]